MRFRIPDRLRAALAQLAGFLMRPPTPPTPPGAPRFDPHAPHLPPPERLPGDAGDNRGEL